jgi:hypothetical protein
MKQFILLLGLSVFLACSNWQQEQSKLQVDKFIWSAYSWHLNDTTNQYVFYLGEYLEIAPSGEGFLMRHDTFMGRPHFYSFHLTDAQLSQLNATFSGRVYADSYTPTEPIIYCGPTYSFAYRVAKQSKTIRYIPPALPESLQEIVKLLEKSTAVERVQLGEEAANNPFFHYVGYSKQLEKQLIETEGAPVPPKVSSVQFVPPDEQ